MGNRLPTITSVADLDEAVWQGSLPNAWSRENMGVTERTEPLWLAMAQHLLRETQFRGDESKDGEAPEQKLGAYQQMLWILLRGQGDAEAPDPRQQSDFRNGLHGRLREPRESKAVMHERQMLYYRLITSGNEQGFWSLCSPAYPVHVRRDLPRTTEDLRDVHAFDGYRETFRKALMDHGEVIARHRFGASLLSAILYGGICHEETLRALTRQRGRLLEHGPVGTWLDLDLYPGTRQARRARLHFDALTEALWLAAATEATESATDPDQRIRALLTDLGYQRKGMRSVVQATRAALSLDYSEILVRYAAGELVTHALEPTCWISIQQQALEAEEWQEARPRVRGRQKLVSLLEMPSAESETEDEEDPGEPLSELYTPPGLTVIEHAVKANSIRSLTERIHALHDLEATIPPIVALMAGWMAKPGERAGAGTRGKMFQAVGRRLTIAFGESDPRDLPESELEESYLSIVEQAQTSAQRNRVLIALKSFDQYLFRRGPEDQPDGIRGGHPSDVSARIITHDDYQRALAELDRPHPNKRDPHHSTVRMLALTLYFRLGLRKNELLKLSLLDILGSPEDLRLVLRSTPGYRLKTRNATRDLPLRPLLEAEEYARVQRWLAYRTQTDPHPTPATRFLALPDSGQSEMSEDSFIDSIMEAVRRVTGDPLLTLHHLRHSFATWTTLAEVGHAEGDDFRSWAHLPETYDWLCRTAERLDPSYEWVSPLRRNRMYQITHFLGHANPGTTLEHYVHELGPLLRDLLWQEPPLAPNELDPRAVGISRSWQKRWAYEGWPQFMTRLRRLVYPGSYVSREPAPRNTGAEPMRELTLLERCKGSWEFLKRLDNEGIDPESDPLPRAKLGGDPLNWIKRRNELRQRRVLEGPYPGHAYGRQQGEILEGHAQRIALAQEEPQQRAAWHRILATWSNHRLQGRRGITFAHAQTARQYIDDLLAIGFSWSELHLRWLSWGHNKGEAGRCRTQWRKALRLSGSVSFEAAKRVHDDPRDVSGCGLVEISVGPLVDQKVKARPFNWLMIMAYITDGLPEAGSSDGEP